MAKKIFLFYHPGTYGSFLRWVIEYTNDLGHRYHNIPTNPLLDDGTAHYRGTLPRNHPENIFDALEEDAAEPYQIYRLLPKTKETDDTVATINEFVRRKNPEDSVIFIDPSTSDTKWAMFLNLELKTNFVEQFHSPLVEKWRKGTDRFADLARWEQREFMSMYYVGMTDSLLELKGRLHQDVMVLTMDDVVYRANFLPPLLLQHTDLPPKPRLKRSMSHVERIHRLMYERQEGIKTLANLHTNMEYFVSHIDNFELRPMTLFGEAMFQHWLDISGLEFQCYGLDTFPTTIGAVRALCRQK